MCDYARGLRSAERVKIVDITRHCARSKADEAISLQRLGAKQPGDCFVGFAPRNGITFISPQHHILLASAASPYNRVPRTVANRSTFHSCRESSIRIMRGHSVSGASPEERRQHRVLHALHVDLQCIDGGDVFLAQQRRGAASTEHARYPPLPLTRLLHPCRRRGRAG